jgi:hypothetical protein
MVPDSPGVSTTRNKRMKAVGYNKYITTVVISDRQL